MSSDSSGGAAQRLLDAAEVVVVHNGWRAATSRAIAAQAQLNPGLVNYYFGSKDELLRQALQRSFDRFAEPMAELLARASLVDTVAALTASLDSDDVSGEAKMLFEASLESLRDPVLRELTVAKLAEFRTALFGRLLVEGWEELRARGVATLLAAALDGLLLHRLLDPRTDVSAAARVLADVAG